MSDEYIRKADVVNACQEGWNNSVQDCINNIKALKPADVVPVVRCKDCKYNATTHKCLNPDSFFLIPKDDDFCSYGKRREE